MSDGPTGTAAPVLQTIVGLLALLALAYVGAHRRVRRAERTLGLSSAITAGFPFVALGLLARNPLGVLTDETLEALTPLLHFGLGWIGFLQGVRFDMRELDRLPRGTGVLVALQTIIPFLTIAVGCGAVMLLFGRPFSDATLVRDGFVLATAGAMTSPVALRLISRIRGERTALSLVSELDDVAGVVGLALLAAYFRPALASTWAIPGTAWLFVTLGLGLTIGVVLYATLLRPSTPPEAMAIALGAIAFAAGLSSYLHLSPIVVCFVAGVVITNLPGKHRGTFRETLKSLERPIYLLFLTIAGATWRVADWRGWALMAGFLLTRAAGMAAAAALAKRREGAEKEESSASAFAASPLSVMSIAIVVNVQVLYRSQAIYWMMTAVLGGAVVMEIASQLWRRSQLGPAHSDSDNGRASTRSAPYGEVTTSSAEKETG